MHQPPRRLPAPLKGISVVRMRCIRLVLGLCLALAAAAFPARAQDAPVRSDTVRGPVFSDRVIAEAFGLTDPDDRVMETLRKELRCGRDGDVYLCNLEMRGSPGNDCANAAVMGQFAVVFGVLKGQPQGKQVYVAVGCGDEPQVTVSSRWDQGSVRFTLEKRNGPKSSEQREVVYVRTR